MKTKFKFNILIFSFMFLPTIFAVVTASVSATEDSYFNCQTIAKSGLKKGQKCFCPSESKEIKVFQCTDSRCTKNDVSFFCESGVMPGQ